MSRLALALLTAFSLRVTETFASGCLAELQQPGCETKGGIVELKTPHHQENLLIAAVESPNDLLMRLQQWWGDCGEIANQKIRSGELLVAGRPACIRQAFNQGRVPFQASVEGNLLKGLSFLLVFYVARVQLRIIRRARERQSIFRGLDFVNFTKRIDREFRERDFSEGDNTRQQGASLTPQLSQQEFLLNSSNVEVSRIPAKTRNQ